MCLTQNSILCHYIRLRDILLAFIWPASSPADDVRPGQCDFVQRSRIHQFHINEAALQTWPRFQLQPAPPGYKKVAPFGNTSPAIINVRVFLAYVSLRSGARS